MCFCVLSSSLICQIGVRLEFRLCVLSLTIVVIAYEGDYSYLKWRDQL